MKRAPRNTRTRGNRGRRCLDAQCRRFPGFGLRGRRGHDEGRSRLGLRLEGTSMLVVVALDAFGPPGDSVTSERGEIGSATSVAGTIDLETGISVSARNKTDRLTKAAPAGRSNFGSWKARVEVEAVFLPLIARPLPFDLGCDEASSSTSSSSARLECEVFRAATLLEVGLSLLAAVSRACRSLSCSSRRTRSASTRLRRCCALSRSASTRFCSASRSRASSAL